MFRAFITPFTRKARSFLNLPYRSFSTQVQKHSKLQTQLQSQITHEEDNAEDLSNFVNFFENSGFSVNYNDVQVELSKNVDRYEVRLLFNAKTPLSMPQEAQENQEYLQNSNPNYQQITVLIRKTGINKWLCADFFHSEEQSQIHNVFFVEDYDKIKDSKLLGKMSSSLGGYVGPDLASVEENIEKGIIEFIEAVGVNQEIVGRAAQFSVAYEQKFYIQWLKNLKSLL